jgi:elongation factor G
MHSDEMQDIEYANAGDIIAMFGVECASGDTFTDGKTEVTMTSMFVPNPVISLAVSPKDKAGLVNFSKALNRFSKEDPTFRVHRDDSHIRTVAIRPGADTRYIKLRITDATVGYSNRNVR